MSTTEQITQFFDTNGFPVSKESWGELKPILNEAIAGAKNVVVELRWVESGKKFQPAVIDKHQLLYFLEGDGIINLEGKDHKVGKGAGIYLGPQETASITAAPGSKVKLFHITVPNKLP
jgi:mannose-6-phosphate isomerase-like protein (cupin superfamily)